MFSAKIFKKIAGVFFLALLVFGLTGCAGTSNPNPGPDRTAIPTSAPYGR